MQARIKITKRAALSIPLRCFSILLQNTMDLIPEYVLLNGIGEDQWE
jgi:hypothetical protein